MHWSTLKVQDLLLVCGMACAVMWVSGCASTSTGLAGSDTQRLEKDLAAKNEKIVKLTAASANHIETIRSLEEELQRTRDYLEYAEEQFISLERGLQSQESKASAVATLAEAKLAYDKCIREDARAHTLANVRQAKGKIEKSEELLPQKRYAAAVYFARRAIRLLETSPQTIIHIVAVNQANLRRGPGLKFDVVHRLDLGTVLIQTDDDKDWYQVKTREGKLGWVHQSVTVAP